MTSDSLARGARLYRDARYQEAADSFSTALAECGEDAAGRAHCLMCLGGALRGMGKLHEAIDRTHEAVRLARSARDSETEIASLGNLGNCYSDMGLYQKAIEAHRQSYELARRAGDRIQERKRASDLGTVYQALGEKEPAQRWYRLAVDLSEKLPGDRIGLAYALSNLVSLMLEPWQASVGAWRVLLKDSETSEAIVRRAADAAGVPYDVKPSRLIQGLAGECLRSCNRALDISQEAGDLIHAARQHLHRAVIFLLLGKVEASRKSYRSALEDLQGTSEIIVKVEALAGLGNLSFLSGQTREAVSCYQEALKIGTPDRETAFVLHRNLATACAESGDNHSAFDHYARAIDIREAARSELTRADWKESYVAEKGGVYDQMVTFLCGTMAETDWAAIRRARRKLPAEPAEAAFEYAERAKARVLVDLIARDIEQIAGELNDQTLRNLFLDLVHAAREEAGVGAGAGLKSGTWQSIESQGMTEAEAAKQRRVRAEQELADAHPELSSLVSVHPLRARDIREDVLTEEDVLLEYYGCGDGSLMAFVVDKSGVVSVPIGSSGNRGVTAVLHELFRPVASDGQRRKDGLLPLVEEDEGLCWPFEQGLAGFRAAYDLLLPCPVRDLLEIGKPAGRKRRKRLVIVAHGQLHGLAFHALTPDGTGFLIDEFEKGIIYVPSATALWYCRQKRPRGVAESALILGHSFPDDPDWPPIPGVREHALRLAAFYNAEPYLDERATPRALIENAGGADAVIILTHGRDVAETEDPLLRSFVLAGGEVTVRALYALRAPATLHDYGTCFSATATPRAGDEFVSLTRGAFCSGARSVLASLWGLPDEAAVRLSMAFHENWRQCADKGLALKKAMEFVRAEWPNPVYWAPLILTGDWH